MINHDADKYKSCTDFEELINRRVNQKFDKFSKDIINEHNKTRVVVEQAITVMKKTQHNKVHIAILYTIALTNLLFHILNVSGVL